MREQRFDVCVEALFVPMVTIFQQLHFNGMDHIDVQTKVDWFDVAWVEAFVFEPGVQAASESFGVFLFGGTVRRISHKGVQGGAVGDGPKSLSLGLVGHGGIRRRRRRRGVE